MSERTELHNLLVATLGSNNVYFQPPASLQMTYPCITYKRDTIKTKYANDKPYSNATRYLVTVIDRNPDSSIVEKIKLLPKCSFNRNYIADNLNHDVFTLFF